MPWAEEDSAAQKPLVQRTVDTYQSDANPCPIRNKVGTRVRDQSSAERASPHNTTLHYSAVQYSTIHYAYRITHCRAGTHLSATFVTHTYMNIFYDLHTINSHDVEQHWRTYCRSTIILDGGDSIGRLSNTTTTDPLLWESSHGQTVGIFKMKKRKHLTEETYQRENMKRRERINTAKWKGD